MNTITTITIKDNRTGSWSAPGDCVLAVAAACVSVTGVNGGHASGSEWKSRPGHVPPVREHEVTKHEEGRQEFEVEKRLGRGLRRSSKKQIIVMRM